MALITPFKLKDNFVLGVASAATQIEGGDLDHNWMAWARQGKIKDGSSPARANQHYQLFREDLELMAAMGIKAYRFGIEWARIEPAEGVFEHQVLEHYKDSLVLMKKLGIQPLLTLYHFVHPMWFEKKGAFTKVENVPIFLRFTETCVRYFGDLVNEYITINEPNVFAMLGYFIGVWPPGEHNLFRAIKVMSVQAQAHLGAYELIHRLAAENGRQVQVSFAHHVRAYAPKNPKNPWHRLWTSLMRRVIQTVVTKAFFTGEFAWPMQNLGPAPVPKGRYIDFIAINYYTRSTVSGPADGYKQDAMHNDLGWEIYPEGLSAVVRELYAVLPLPVYITENGTCDNTDSFRARYVAEHLAKIAAADSADPDCVASLPVQRYYHWCFIDNFEWAEGETARFGLVHCDYDSQKRTIKHSGLMYRDIIASHALTQEIIEQYVASSRYRP